MREKPIDLKTQIVIAASDCTGGDLDKTFTSEELLLRAWKRWPQSWGLRGFESDHPDSHRVHRELDSRGKGAKGVVSLGLLEKVRPRVYRLTPKGLAVASEASPDKVRMREQATRELETEVRRILQHPAFLSWLKDPSEPRRFRDAGRFWRIAPGTPARVIGERLQRVEDSLQAASRFLESRETDEVTDRHGRHLYDRTDLERCLEFHHALSERFSEDLKVLGVDAL